MPASFINIPVLWRKTHYMRYHGRYVRQNRRTEVQKDFPNQGITIQACRLRMRDYYLR